MTNCLIEERRRHPQVVRGSIAFAWRQTELVGLDHQKDFVMARLRLPDGAIEDCSAYNPQERGYGAVASRIVSLGGLFTMIVLGGFFFLASRAADASLMGLARAATTNKRNDEALGVWQDIVAFNDNGVIQ